mgnify:CR=1 FL=1
MKINLYLTTVFVLLVNISCEDKDEIAGPTAKFGYVVDDLAYVLYVDGQHLNIKGMINEDTTKANMIFNTSLLLYEGDDSWVEKKLFEIKESLHKTECPDHAKTGFGPKGVTTLPRKKSF